MFIDSPPLHALGGCAMLLRPGSSMFHADQPTSPVGSALEDYLGADGASKLRAALPQMKIANSAQQSLELSPGETKQASSVRISPEQSHLPLCKAAVCRLPSGHQTARRESLAIFASRS